MAAGLPGTGIGGLFFILSAFFMVIAEAINTVRGRSSLARWRIVGRHAGIAAAMVAAITLTIWILHGLLFPAAKHGSTGAASNSDRLVPFAPVLITFAALVTVLVTAKIAQLLVRERATTPREDAKPESQAAADSV